MKRLLLIAVLLLACENPTKDEPYCYDGTNYLNYTVKYQVTGTAATVDLTIENADGGTSQYSDKPVPWTHTFTSKGDTWVYCSAQNQGNTGSVTVTIYVNEAKFKQSTSEGAYVIASASGSIDGDLYSEIVEICF